MKILFIQTGGTIDKDYPKTDKGFAFEITEPAVHRILSRTQPAFTFDVVSLFKKDSQEITNADRAQLKVYLSTRPEQKVVITHGTDTLIQTAKFLGTIPGKTIVFTGAFKPERLKDSDADVNLGLALGAINVLEEGTFIAMNGLVMIPENCEKDPVSGQFITLKDNLE
ncbi:asparaginase domain-containing protein [Roseivirga pacifica]|uniref:asparaginase domain-containing protein n=1 Tax=Roseivirga pacifica TaxID=1267423 RepID=UPI003BB1E70B